MSSFIAQGKSVAIRRPVPADCEEFIALMEASKDFHYPWTDFPKTRERFDAYLRTRQASTEDGFLVCLPQTNRIVGVINLNCIVRGFLQSAYLGYCIGATFARRGYMTEGMQLAAQVAFGELGLHRLEANIQPENLASIALVRKNGFRKEGFSPKYLQVYGQWRDHERWALLADDPR
jgi:[ribosomal protein S5]-alanine N-acetyltransferase